jgi:microcystin-dependent protein
MSDPFLGQIKIFAGNFAPHNWAYCNGQLLSINQYQALFSILGTIYGGDGETTFALPDLRGRVAIHAGQGPGLTQRNLGSKSGQNEVVMTNSNLPSHAHEVPVNESEADADDPEGQYLATTVKPAYSAGPISGQYGSTTTNAGENQAINNIQPYLGLNYIIALVGVFPSRN